MSIMVMSEMEIMRPRTQTTKPSRLSEAVTELRGALRQTQQQFAETVGTSITTIARYETSRTPSGPILIRLRQLSVQLVHENPDNDELRDLDDVFYSAVVDEFAVYRHAVVAGLYEAAGKLLVLCGEVSKDGFREGADVADFARCLANESELVLRYAEILDPISFLLPKNSSAEDVAEVFLPMFDEGVARWTEAAAVEAVMRRQRCRKAPVGKDKS